MRVETAPRTDGSRPQRKRQIHLVLPENLSVRLILWRLGIQNQAIKIKDERQWFDKCDTSRVRPFLSSYCTTSRLSLPQASVQAYSGRIRQLYAGDDQTAPTDDPPILKLPKSAIILTDSRMQEWNPSNM